MASPVPSPSESLPVEQGRLAEFQSDVVGGLRRLHSRFGPIAAVDDGQFRVIFTFDPAYSKQILSDYQKYHSRFFAIRGPKRSSHRRVTSGLFEMNGDHWKRNRRMLKEPFGLKQIAEYGETIDKLANETASGWNAGDEFDMAEEMVRFLLSITSSLLFGLGADEDERQLTRHVGEQVAEWARMNHELGIGALVPDSAFSRGYEDLLKLSEEIEQQVLKMIAIRREAERTGRNHRNDMLSILVRAHDDQGGLSDEELVGQTCVLFTAAHMTTANSMTWTLLLLAQHPEIMRALAEEMASSPERPGRPDPNSLLERIIRESMRVLPASSYSQRINTEPVDIGPFKQVPRGTPMVFSPFITHYLESIYDEPRRFNPDRWLTIKPTAYEYLPFGAGPRMCVGGPLALETIRRSLPILLRGRRLKVTPGAEVDAQIRSTVLLPLKGLPMQIHEDDGAYEASPMTGTVCDILDLPC